MRNKVRQDREQQFEQDQINFLVEQANDLKEAFDIFVAGETFDMQTAIEIREKTNFLLSQFNEAIEREIAELTAASRLSADRVEFEDVISKLELLRWHADSMH